MGYVRMIRSGGLHFVSNSMKFVPNQQTEGTFKDLAKEELVSKETVEGRYTLRYFFLFQDIFCWCTENKDFETETDFFDILRRPC